MPANPCSSPADIRQDLMKDCISLLVSRVGDMVARANRMGAETVRIVIRIG